MPNWVWKAREESWKIFYQALRSYQEGFKSIFVPHDYVNPNGLKLGSWAYRQKYIQKKSLNASQIEILESIPSWNWDIDSKEKTKWETGYSYLEKYFKEMGSSRVSESFITTDDFRLGAWMRVQRERIKKGVEDENFKCFEVFPDWAVNMLDVMWEKGFSYLKDYVNSSGFKLGKWVAGQRHSKFPDPIRNKRLESLNGCSWDPHAKQWNDAYELLCRTWGLYSAYFLLFTRGISFG